MTRWLLAIALGLGLVGCSLQPLRVERGWAAHQQQVAALAAFHAEGRLAYRNAEEGMNANFSWDNSPNGFALRLSGPFGAGAVRIEFRDGRLLVSNRGHEELDEAQDPSLVLFQHTGLWLPVDAFAYWVTGIPMPGPQFDYQLNPQQQLAQLQQDGWTVAYTRYTQVGELWLPDRLTLTRDAIRIRLVIDRWAL